MGMFDLDLEFEAETANLKSQFANTQITTPKLHAGSLSVDSLSAISAVLGDVTTGTLTSVTITASTFIGNTFSGTTFTGSTITGGTIIGATFKTATSGQRVEIDSVNGVRIYSAGGLQSQFLGAAVTLPNQVIATQHLVDEAVSQVKLALASVGEDQLIAASVTAGKILVGTLAAITADMGTVNAGTINGVTINGGTITGSLFQTDVTGTNRVYIDSTYGLLLLDSSDVTHVALNASIYAGILLNGLRSIDSNDIFMESNDQTCQLFVSSASQRVSFVAGSATRGYFDDQDGSGAGNLPTSLVVRVNGSLQRVNRASAGGFLYI